MAKRDKKDFDVFVANLNNKPTNVRHLIDMMGFLVIYEESNQLIIDNYGGFIISVNPESEYLEILLAELLAIWFLYVDANTKPGVFSDSVSYTKVSEMRTYILRSIARINSI